MKLLGLQTSCRIFAKRDPLVVKEVIHLPRIPCAAVQVVGQRPCAEPAFGVAVCFVPLARAAAGILCLSLCDAGQGNESIRECMEHGATLHRCCFLRLVKAACCAAVLCRFPCEPLKVPKQAA